MELWQAAQAVQRSAFPTAYATWEATAANALAQIGDVACSRAGDRLHLDGRQQLRRSGRHDARRNRAPSTGLYEDDPTTRGCVTPTTRFALEQARTAFGEVDDSAYLTSTRCFADRPANPTGDHPLGKGTCSPDPRGASRPAATSTTMMM